MPVQLLPFQQVVDMPMSKQRRCAICALAVASIVFVSIILVLYVFATIFANVLRRYESFAITLLVGVPSAVILAALVCTSSAISIRNTDKWVSTDVCCNLMRSYPACCTKSCGGNKHCCARMSCLHIAVSVWATLCFFVGVTILSYACNQGINSNSYGREHGYYTYYSNGSPSRINFACALLSGFEVPVLILMVCLAATSAVSAWLLRQVEQGQPETEDLPAGKMVVQACPGNATTELALYAPPVVTARAVDETETVVNGAETASLMNNAV